MASARCPSLCLTRGGLEARLRPGIQGFKVKENQQKLVKDTRGSHCSELNLSSCFAVES